MKFILKEYIATLKEDQELDSLLSDLLFNMNITPLTKPTKGRQHGVDVCAVGIDPEDRKKKVFLLVIKQGNFSRNNWDTGKNDIRTTLNEVKDAYIPTSLPPKYKALPKKILVCCNGDLNQNVNINWSQYVKRNSKKGKVEYDFWGVDTISQLMSEYFISENIFPAEDKTLLRKTLAFLDLSDYDLSHFYQLIRNLLQRNSKGKKQITKKIRLVGLCLNILFKWANDIKNTKPVIVASERVLLNTWDWMRTNSLLKNRDVMQEFYKLHLYKLSINRAYFIKLQNHCYVRDGLAGFASNHIEYSLITWDQIGLISTIGLTEFFEYLLQQNSAGGSKQKAKAALKNAAAISDGLANLLSNNPPSNYPKYDEHVIEVTLALILFWNTNNKDFSKNWINGLVSGLNSSVQLTGFIPLFHTSYDKLLEVSANEDEVEITSSVLITILAEWCCIHEVSALYQAIRKLIELRFKDINLQLWFAEDDTDNLYYTQNAMESGSTKHSISLYEDPAKYKKEMLDEIERFPADQRMTFFAHGFYYLGYLASRHFRTYPLPIFWRGFQPKPDVEQEPTI